jgi:hypothetical protein
MAKFEADDITCSFPDHAIRAINSKNWEWEDVFRFLLLDLGHE